MFREIWVFLNDQPEHINTSIALESIESQFYHGGMNGPQLSAKICRCSDFDINIETSPNRKFLRQENLWLEYLKIFAERCFASQHSFLGLSLFFLICLYMSWHFLLIINLNGLIDNLELFLVLFSAN